MGLGKGVVFLIFCAFMDPKSKQQVLFVAIAIICDKASKQGTLLMSEEVGRVLFHNNVKPTPKRNDLGHGLGVLSYSYSIDRVSVSEGGKSVRGVLAGDDGLKAEFKIGFPFIAL